MQIMFPSIMQMSLFYKNVDKRSAIPKNIRMGSHIYIVVVLRPVNK